VCQVVVPATAEPGGNRKPESDTPAVCLPSRRVRLSYPYAGATVVSALDSQIKPLSSAPPSTIPLPPDVKQLTIMVFCRVTGLREPV